jgi:predicted permease
MAGSRFSSSAGLGRDRLRSALVALELSMAVVLLVGAALLLRSFVHLTSVAPGFDPDHVLTFTVELPKTTYERTAQVDNVVRDVLDRLHHVPSVTYAAVGSSVPLGVTDYTVISRPGAPPAAAGLQVAGIQAVSAEFHKTFGIDLRRGRLLNDEDNGSALAVALINETMARQFWPDTDPIGKSIQWVVAQRDLRIVGVVADVRQRGLASPAPPILYIPAAQNTQTNRHLAFAVRSRNEPWLIARTVREIVRHSDPALPVFGLQTAEDIVSQSTGTPRFNLFIVAIFAGAALILATCGLYAVISYIVGLSFREFGIRLALGATSGNIVRMIMMRGTRLVGIGIAIGVVGALGATRFISSLLFGVPPTDALTFGTVVIVLVTVSLFAIAVPALRATRVDPIMAVRQE